MDDAAADNEIRAAGCVLWRPGARGAEIALVHRSRYDDWSLPKGKREPGEHVLETAVREVAEETGVAVVLGRRLRSTRYQRGERPKLSYARDADVLDDFASGPADTVPCILLRHSGAGSKGGWPADDLLRPLDAQGLRDAEVLARLLSCYAPPRGLSF